MAWRRPAPGPACSGHAPCCVGDAIGRVILAMFPLRTLLERLGFPRQLGLIVAFFALTIVCLLALVGAAFHVMSGVRAYVGGEGLWSKSQKAAVRALEHAIDGDEQALIYFDAIFAVPLGDRRARK